VYKILIKPLLFRMSPEKAHHVTASLLRMGYRIPGMAAVWRTFYGVKRPDLSREIFGLRFPNPVGLAAGFDKDARMFRELGCFGFGFIEIGTLTPKPQEGNPRPRLFRLPKDRALINRMGFNNHGVDDAVQRLKRRRTNLIVGGNIGKNKITPNEEALNDYLICLRALHPVVDYFVVNISSPNTPNLRELQEKEPLRRLLNAVMAENNRLTPRRPVLLKIAPDVSNGQIDDILEIIAEAGVDGIIATNTTVSREGLSTGAEELESIGAGGLSGRPVRARSTEVIRYIHTQTGGRLPIIGVGGIHSAADAKEKLDAGATLVQVYTGFVYEGPGLVKRICAGL
jgi:dihydroorotate dehydrogenase